MVRFDSTETVSHGRAKTEGGLLPFTQVLSVCEVTGTSKPEKVLKNDGEGKKAK